MTIQCEPRRSALEFYNASTWLDLEHLISAQQNISNIFSWSLTILTSSSTCPLLFHFDFINQTVRQQLLSQNLVYLEDLCRLTQAKVNSCRCYHDKFSKKELACAALITGHTITYTLYPHCLEHVCLSAIWTDLSI